MTHVAHGAKSVFGKPWDAGGLAAAMPHCTKVHGPGGILPNAEIGHRTGGYPEFDGWPRFTGQTHHQAYVDWVKRAYDAGLRLLVMLVSNNELLGKFLGSTRPYDDRSVVNASIDETGRMIEYIDGKSGGPGRGWMQLARTPAEARKIIASGKLAVVLGVEVDSLGNWHKPGDLPADLTQARAQIAAYLRDLHGRGVRHVFPVHLADNAFGGTAVWSRAFDLANFVLTGSFFEVEDGARFGVSYRLDRDDFLPSWVQTLLWPALQIASHGGYGTHEKTLKAIAGGHINKRGLTPYGKIAVEELMKLGMIVDIDHMGVKARTDTFALAEARKYPLFSGHTRFKALALPQGLPQNQANDFRLSDEEVARIRRLGGMISPALNHTGLLSAPGSAVPNDCDGSSKSFAQAYLYAVSKMGGAPVGLGTDINGWAQLPAPRFGTRACWGSQMDPARRAKRRAQIDAQQNGVRYGSPILEYRFTRFERDKDDPAYNDEERDIWEAIAIFKAGKDPRRDRIDRPGLLHRTPWAQNKINNIATGFLLTGREEDFKCGLLPGDCPHEKRAAYYVRAGRAPEPTDAARVRALYPVVKRVWDRWAAAEGKNAPLARVVAGRRDFDLNLDGMAHYGLLADFLQDLRNVGLREKDLNPLYRSAAAYVDVWERAEARARSR
jgi:microsomal dipeptidase-like Zn-dependent dipeptidase